jgi:hypothetical protein
MTKAEVAVIILGLTLIGAAIWVPSLSDRTRALLLLIVMAAGILLMLHQLPVSSIAPHLTGRAAPEWGNAGRSLFQHSWRSRWQPAAWTATD